MRLMKFAGLALAAAVLVSGCATPPPVSFAPDDVMASKAKVNAEMKSVTVVISDDVTLETGFGPAGGNFFIEPWKNALEDALVRSSTFDDEAKEKVTIRAKLLKYKMQPGFDIDVTFTTNYQIISRKNGKVLYETDVSTVGTCTFEEQSYGYTRIRVAMNRAGQNNIKEFIRRLEAVAPQINETIQKMATSTK